MRVLLASLLLLLTAGVVQAQVVTSPPPPVPGADCASGAAVTGWPSYGSPFNSHCGDPVATGTINTGTVGQLPEYSGTATLSGITPGGDVTFASPNFTVGKINGSPLGTTTATSGNLLIGSGSQWVTQPISGDATLAAGGALTIAAGAITSGKLVAGVAASNLGFTPLNPGLNLSDVNNITSARLNLGLGLIATHSTADFMAVNNNLSEGVPATMRANLGLGSSATVNTGTSGARLGLLNADLDFSGALTLSGVTSGTQTVCLGLNTNNLLVSSSGACGTGGGGSGISGLTTGQIPVAGSTTTVTSSVPFGTTGNSTLVETSSGGTISNTLISGLPNANLANPSLTVGSTNIALGATASTLAGLTLTSPTINGATLSGTLAGTPTFSGIPIFSGLSTGTQVSCVGLDSGNNLVLFGSACGAGGVSGLTTGQIPIAGSASTVTSSIPFGTTGNSTLVETSSGGTISNTLISGLPNANLANSAVTIGSTPISLGATAATVAGLTLTAPTVNGGTITSAAVTGLSSPSVASDAANKGYVDAAVTGAVVHTQVAAATAAILPNSPTASGTGVGKTLTAGANAALVVDGHTVLLNERILVKNQATASDNGIYVQTTLGTGSVPWVLTRATDFDQAAAGEVALGAYMFVTFGTAPPSGNIGTLWQLGAPTPSSITVDTTALTFSILNAAAANAVTGSGSPTPNNVPKWTGTYTLDPVGYPIGTTGASTLVQTSAGGTISNTLISGLPNGSLANPSLTIGSTSVALGATAATLAGLTLTNPTISGGASLAGTIAGTPTWSGTPLYTGLSAGTQVSCMGLDSTNHLVKSGAACGTGTISGLTTGQIPLAGGASTLTSSLPVGTTGNSTVVQTSGGGTIANSLISGLPNANLLNSSVTVGSTNIALGGTAGTVAGLTLTTPTVNGATLAGTLAGTPTYSGVPVYSGLSAGTQVSCLGLDSGNHAVLNSNGACNTIGIGADQAVSIITATPNTLSSLTKSTAVQQWTSATASAKTQNIPGCVAGIDGAQVLVIDAQGTAGQYNITITPASGTIGPQSSASFVLGSSNGGVLFRCYGAGTRWVVVWQSAPGSNVRDNATSSLTIAGPDNGNVIQQNNGSTAWTMSMAAGGSPGFPAGGFVTTVMNLGTAAGLFTPTTSSVNGASTYTIPATSGIMLFVRNDNNLLAVPLSAPSSGGSGAIVQIGTSQGTGGDGGSNWFGWTAGIGTVTYNAYEVDCQDLAPGTNQDDFAIQFGEGGGGSPTWETGSYYSELHWVSTSSAGDENSTLSGSYGVALTGLANHVGSDARRLRLHATISSLNTNTSLARAVDFHASYNTGSGADVSTNGSGAFYGDTGIITALRIIAYHAGVPDTIVGGSCTLTARTL